MKVLDEITTAGGGSANEDRYGYRGTLAWIIDGATNRYSDSVLPGQSDVVWLVDFLQHELMMLGEHRYAGDGKALVEKLAAKLASEMERLSFPPGRVPPICSIGVLIDQGKKFECVRVGDVSMVTSGTQIEVLDTSYFDNHETDAVQSSDGYDKSQVDAVLNAQRISYIKGLDGESVLSGHHQRGLRSYSLRGSWSNITSILLCSDGFTRLITDYHLYPDWNTLLAACAHKGVTALVDDLRSFESSGDGSGIKKFKKADDATAIVICPSPGDETAGLFPH